MFLEVEGLTKRYGGRRVQAVVDDIAFHVDAGEIFGILGPNGAGKTTAVECMEGLRRRDGGEADRIAQMAHPLAGKPAPRELLVDVRRLGVGLGRNAQRWNPASLGERQGAGVAVVADHQPGLRIELAGVDRGDHGARAGSIPGCEEAQIKALHLHRNSRPS